MKYKKHTYFRQVITIITLCLTVLMSCFHDEALEMCEEKGLIIVNLATDGLNTRAAGDQLFTGDEAITMARIFVFSGDVLEVNKLFVSGETQFVNPFILEVITGTKNIYVVANETSELSTKLASVTSESGLAGLMAQIISAPLSTPLIMTGSTPGVVVGVEEGSNSNNTSVMLTRVAAKISLKFKKDTDADVSITKVSLLNNAGVTTIWDNGVLNNGDDNWEWNHNLLTPLVLGSTSLGIEGQESIYLYENLTNGDKNKATRLEVEALYNGVPTKYRVYINENITLPGSGISGDPTSSETDPSSLLYSIKRNHHYQLNGTIIDMGEFDGLTLTTNVLPWDMLQSSISFERKFTISPTPTLENRTYTVDSSGKVEFTFKLTSPIDASWVANLTDIANFELVGTSQGRTDEEVVITIKVKNAPGMEVRTTEFYINAEYGGNWAELPLLSGSDLFGVGSRVVISQPAN
ncbi:MAG: hypothetical protein ITF98_09625 [Fermentimonas sp.]|nr:hypothetical protein [Fermentimonas sp.]